MDTRTIALFVALLGCGCASSAPKPSSQAVILDVPCALQESETYACGLVSVQSLCSYWGVALPEAVQTKIAQTAEHEHGLSGAELRAQLESLGFETFLFEGRLDHGVTGLFQEIDRGRPVLLLLEPEPEHGHYVLCVGYDEPQRSVCLLDAQRGRVLVPYDVLEKTWSAREHFTLLAVPRSPANPMERKAEAP
jgi:ABC-type bacteriocin/lantibiotic exporter with double-glycine peptidase domain